MLYRPVNHFAGKTGGRGVQLSGRRTALHHFRAPRAPGLLFRTAAFRRNVRGITRAGLALAGRSRSTDRAGIVECGLPIKTAPHGPDSSLESPDPRHRRGADRIPADLLDRPPHSRRRSARFQRRSRQIVRDRHPVRRHSRRGLGVSRAFAHRGARGIQRQGRAEIHPQPVHRLPAAGHPRAGLRQGDQGQPVQPDRGGDDLHSRRLRHSLGGAARPQDSRPERR